MKLIDCITFFDNDFIFEVRYNILKNYVDHFIICEAKYDHKGFEKPKNFIFKDYFDKKKIKYLFLEKPFPKNNDPWKNQAIQREFILENLDFANGEDYVFFSDPDEIPNPKILKNFNLKKKYGIFLQDCFNYKFNLFNPHESPWEGTRVAKKKNLKSIDFMRQKVKSKNLKYSFFRFDKETNLELFRNGGWHFNNVMTPEKISLKLKTFAHTEFSDTKYSSIEVIKKKIENKIDLFERGHNYQVLILDSKFPDFILKNKEKFKDYIIS
jgi:beta-1,4-mannosyl-glycoprotein beta-1,4-N-acetylglucosaminyltransferase